MKSAVRCHHRTRTPSCADDIAVRLHARLSSQITWQPVCWIASVWPRSPIHDNKSRRFSCRSNPVGSFAQESAALHRWGRLAGWSARSSPLWGLTNLSKRWRPWRRAWTMPGSRANGVVTLTITRIAAGDYRKRRSRADIGNGFLVARTGQDSFTALSAICTHQTCTITNFSNQLFVCPCHGSEFDSARVARGPAGVALHQFPTHSPATCSRSRDDGLDTTSGGSMRLIVSGFAAAVLIAHSASAAELTTVQLVPSSARTSGTCAGRSLRRGGRPVPHDSSAAPGQRSRADECARLPRNGRSRSNTATGTSCAERFIGTPASPRCRSSPRSSRWASRVTDNTAPADNSSKPESTRRFGAGIIGLFGVNTVTGAWNLFGEGRKDPHGRTLRLVHGLLMMAATSGSSPPRRTVRAATVSATRRPTKVTR